MGRSRLRIAVAAVLAAVVSAGGLATPAFADTYTLTGIVLDQQRQPLAGACVALFANDTPTELASTCVDGTGTVTFSGLASGQYRIRARAEGYLDQWFSRAQRWESARGISVPQSFPAEIAMVPGVPAGARGRLLNGDGTPAAAQVTLTPMSSGGWTAWAHTDADGRWEIQGLPPAQYRVGYFGAGYGNAYAFGTFDPAQATIFTLVGGETTVVEDSIPPLGALEVTVTEAGTGAPITRGCVSVPGPTSPQVCDRATGIYTLTDLLPGTWTVSVFPEATHGATTIPNVQIVPGETTRISVSVARVMSLVTTVTDRATGTPLKDICVYLIGPGSHGIASRSSFHCSRPDGRLVIGFPSDTAPLNDLQLYAFDLAGRYGAQWVAGWGGTGDQLVASRIDLALGATTQAPGIRMDPPGSITGTIRDQTTGQPLPGICTYPYAFNPSRGNTFGTNCANTSGQYTISGLGPYEWPVLYAPAQFNGYGWQWSGDKPNRFASTKVTVTAGGSATMDANLSPAGTITGQAADANGRPLFATIRAYSVVTHDFAGPLGTSDFATTYTMTGFGGPQFVKLEYSVSGAGTCWYSNASDWQSATGVWVEPGQVTANIDLTRCSTS